MVLQEIITYVGAKESGKHSRTKIMSNIQGACGSRSNYQKSRQVRPTSELAPKCSYCGTSGYGKNAPFSERKKNCKAYGKTCNHCGLPNHFSSVCRTKAQGLSKPKEKSAPINNSTDTMSECPIWEELCSVQSNSSVCEKEMYLDHHVYMNIVEKWIRKPSKPQPFIPVSASTKTADYEELGFKLLVEPACINISVMPDTGCQSFLAGMKVLKRLGISESHLIPMKLKMSAVNVNKTRSP